MDLRRLGHFLAVADHGGFTRASKAVFVSQPALSLSVRELEEELGAELFYRAGRGVRLTPAGQALLGQARQALRDVDTARAAVASVTGLVTGSLTLGIVLAHRPGPLAPAARRFLELAVGAHSASGLPA